MNFKTMMFNQKISSGVFVPEFTEQSVDSKIFILKNKARKIIYEQGPQDFDVGCFAAEQFYYSLFGEEVGFRRWSKQAHCDPYGRLTSIMAFLPLLFLFTSYCYIGGFYSSFQINMKNALDNRVSQLRPVYEDFGLLGIFYLYFRAVLEATYYTVAGTTYGLYLVAKEISRFINTIFFYPYRVYAQLCRSSFRDFRNWFINSNSAIHFVYWEWYRLWIQLGSWTRYKLEIIYDIKVLYYRLRFYEPVHCHKCTKCLFSKVPHHFPLSRVHQGMTLKLDIESPIESPLTYCGRYGYADYLYDMRQSKPCGKCKEYCSNYYVNYHPRECYCNAILRYCTFARFSFEEQVYMIDRGLDMTSHNILYKNPPHVAAFNAQFADDFAIPSFSSFQVLLEKVKTLGIGSYMSKMYDSRFEIFYDLFQECYSIYRNAKEYLKLMETKIGLPLDFLRDICFMIKMLPSLPTHADWFICISYVVTRSDYMIGKLKQFIYKIYCIGVKFLAGALKASWIKDAVFSQLQEFANISKRNLSQFTTFLMSTSKRDEHLRLKVKFALNQHYSLFANLPDKDNLSDEEIRVFLTEAIKNYRDVPQTKRLAIMDAPSSSFSSSRLLENIKSKSSSLPPFTPQGEIRDAYDAFQMVVDCDLAISLRRLMMQCVYAEMLPKSCGHIMSGVFKSCEVPRKLTLLGFIESNVAVLDSMMGAIKRHYDGETFYKSLLNDSFQSFIVDTNSVIADSENMYFGNEADDGIRTDSRLVMMEALKFIKLGTSMDRTSAPMSFKKRLSDLKSIAHGLQVKHAGMKRKMPYGVILHGPAGVGKSTILDLVYRVWAAKSGIEFNSAMVYTKCMESEYWDEYDPLAQPIIKLPEVGSLKKDIAKSKGDDVINTILTLMDVAPYCVNRSKADEKNMFFANPELVVADTNEKEMNADVVCNHPSAVHRRFLFIEQSVKPEFRLAGSHQIDPKKVPSDPKESMMIYQFRVQEARQPTEGTKTIFVPESPMFIDICDLVETLNERMVIHDEKCIQQKAIKSITVSDVLSLKDNPVRKQYELEARTIQISREISNFIPETDTTAPTRNIDTIIKRMMLKSKMSYKYCRARLKETSYRVFAAWQQEEVEKAEPTLLEIINRRVFFHYIPIQSYNMGLSHQRSAIINSRTFFIHERFNFDWEDPDDLHADLDRMHEKLWDHLNQCYEECTSHNVSKLWSWTSATKKHRCLCGCGDEVIVEEPPLRWYNSIHNIFKRLLERDTYRVDTIIFDPAGMNHRNVVIRWCYQTVASSVVAVCAWSWYVYIMTHLGVWMLCVKRGLDFGYNKLNRQVLRGLVAAASGLAVVKVSLMLVKKAIAQRSLEPLRETNLSADSSYDLEPQTVGIVNDVDNGAEVISRMEDATNAGLPPMKKKTSREDTYDPPENYTPDICNSIVRLSGPENVTAMILKNIRYIHTRGLTSHILGIFENVFLINKHVFNQCDAVTITLKKDKLSGVSIANMRDLEYHVIGDDLIAARAPGLCFKDIRSSINRKFIKTPLMTLDAKIIMFEDREAASKRDSAPVKLSVCYSYPHPGYNGMCGYPLIGTDHKQVFLLGLHSGSVSGISVAQPIITSMIRAIPSRGFTLVSRGTIRFPLTWRLTDVPPKSPLCWEECPGLRIVGSIKNYEPFNGTSSLKKTPYISSIYDIVGVSPYKSSFSSALLFQRPVMAPISSGNNYYAPYNNFVKKSGGVKKVINAKVLQSVVQSFVKRLKNTLEVEEMHPFSKQIAMNGFSANDYVRGINMSTSAGLVYPGKKKDHSIQLGRDGRFEWSLSVEMEKRVGDQLISYSNGELCHPILGAQLKDEARHYTKTDVAKTRVFCNTPYDNLVIQRMYLAPFYTLMQAYNDAFCTAIGINMHSSAADDLYHSLKGGNIIQGDYSGYDTSMPFQIGQAACDVVYQICEWGGYNSKALTILKGLLTDMMFPLVFIQGSIVEIPGFQPSGRYGTAEDNSLRGVILLQYAFAMMCTPLGRDHPHNVHMDYNLDDFWDLFFIRIYGDDFVVKLNEEVKGFDCITYANFCEDEYGMKVTTPAKGTVDKPYVTVDEVDFLKRSFRYHEGLERFVAVLDKQSMVKTLTWIKPSKFISNESLYCQTCRDVFLELFFHSSKVEFEVLREKFITLLEKKARTARSSLESYFPTWDRLVNKYVNTDDLHPELMLHLSAPHVATQTFKLMANRDYPEVVSMVNKAFKESPFTLCAAVLVSSRDWTAGDKLYTMSYTVDGGTVEQQIKQMIVTIIVMAARPTQFFEDYANERRRVPGWFERNRWKEIVTHLVMAVPESEEELKEQYDEWYKDDPPQRGPYKWWGNSEYIHVNWYNNLNQIVDINRDIPDAPRPTFQAKKLRAQRLIGSFTPQMDGGGIIQRDEMPTDSAFDERHKLPDSGVAFHESLESFVGRKLLIRTIEVNRNANGPIIMKPYEQFVKDPAILAKMRNYYTFNGDLSLEFNWSTSQYHYGYYKAAWFPHHEENLTLMNILRHGNHGMIQAYISQTKYVCDIRFGMDEPAVLHCPLLLRKNGIPIMMNEARNGLIGWDKLGIVIVMPIVVVGHYSVMKVPEEIAINCYGNMDKLVLGPPTDTPLSINFQGEADEGGPISKVASTVADTANAVSAVPFIGDFAKSTEMFANSVGSMAKFFGFSKPDEVQDLKSHRMRVRSNFPNCYGTDTVIKMTTDPRQELDLPAYADGKDELAMSTLCSYSSIIDVIHIDYIPTPLRTRILRYPVMPWLSKVDGSGAYLMSPMMFASFPYKMWRGDITFKLEFVMPSNARGKFMVFYEPNAYLAKSLANVPVSMNRVYAATIDVSESKTLTFTTGYMNEIPLKHLPDAGFLFERTSKGYTPSQIEYLAKSNYCSGFVSMVALTTPFPPIDSVDKFHIVVSAHSDNMSYYVPKSIHEMHVIEGEMVRSVPSWDIDEDITPNQPVVEDWDTPINETVYHFEGKPCYFRWRGDNWWAVDTKTYDWPLTGFPKNYYIFPVRITTRLPRDVFELKLHNMSIHPWKAGQDKVFYVHQNSRIQKNPLAREIIPFEPPSDAQRDSAGNLVYWKSPTSEVTYLMKDICLTSGNGTLCSRYFRSDAIFGKIYEGTLTDSGVGFNVVFPKGPHCFVSRQQLRDADVGTVKSSDIADPEPETNMASDYPISGLLDRILPPRRKKKKKKDQGEEEEQERPPTKKKPLPRHPSDTPSRQLPTDDDEWFETASIAEEIPLDRLTDEQMGTPLTIDDIPVGEIFPFQQYATIDDISVHTIKNQNDIWEVSSQEEYRLVLAELNRFGRFAASVSQKVLKLLTFAGYINPLEYRVKVNKKRPPPRGHDQRGRVAIRLRPLTLDEFRDRRQAVVNAHNTRRPRRARGVFKRVNARPSRREAQRRVNRWLKFGEIITPEQADHRQDMNALRERLQGNLTTEKGRKEFNKSLEIAGHNARTQAQVNPAVHRRALKDAWEQDIAEDETSDEEAIMRGQILKKGFKKQTAAVEDAVTEEQELEVGLNKTTISSASFTRQFIGENILSFRTLLKRDVFYFAPTKRFVYVSRYPHHEIIKTKYTVVLAKERKMAIAKTHRAYWYNVGPFETHPLKDDDPTWRNFFAHENEFSSPGMLYNHLSRAFLIVKGGYKWKVISSRPGVVPSAHLVYDHGYRSLEYETEGLSHDYFARDRHAEHMHRVGTYSTARATERTSLQGSVEGHNIDALEVELPYFNSRAFSFAQSRKNTGLDIGVVIENADRIYCSAAEDFGFNLFCGSPMYKTTFKRL